MTTIPASTASTASTATVSFWRSADGQSAIDMSGATAAEALAELLGQCATDEERAGILAGSFVVVA